MLNALVMEGLRRPHEDVITAILGIEPKIMEHSLQLGRDQINLLLWRSPVLFGCSLNINSVLIGSR
jgi:hypothetical protein